MKLHKSIMIGIICLMLTSITGCGGSSTDSAKENLAEKYEDADIGNIIELGEYEQDNNEDNGLETVEWIVIAKEENKLLVLSKYCLDVMPYNNECADVTWETCTLRKWLNDDFYKEVFSKNEADIIIESELTNPDNEAGYYDEGKGGNDTKDKVFLLSIEEIKKYMDSEKERIADATAYARARGEILNFFDSGTGIPSWLLRSPGYKPNYASHIGEDGSISSTGLSVDYDGLCIRPALWIKVK